MTCTARNWVEGRSDRIARSSLTPHLEAIRDALLPTFPQGQADEPTACDAYFEMATGRGVLRSPTFTLRIARECFQGRQPQEIEHALSILGYSGLLRSYRRLVLERVTCGSPSDRTVVEWKGWRLIVGN
ncbi:MAG TPA: hypothetical protein VFJ45_01155 [bacterium]|nr:hypothetical protein [bacterium]